MQRTFPGRFITCALLGVLATGAACGGQEPFQPPPGSELNVSAVPPPPISGGTLLITRDDVAVAADADRDLVWIVDTRSQGVPRQVRLQAGDEPGRLVEDGAGRVHVALRRGAALATPRARAASTCSATSRRCS